MTDQFGGVNRETWMIVLWFANDNANADLARKTINGLELYDGAKALKAFVEELNPICDPKSIFFNLIAESLKKVDWDAVAQAFQED